MQQQQQQQQQQKQEQKLKQRQQQQHSRSLLLHCEQHLALYCTLPYNEKIMITSLKSMHCRQHEANVRCRAATCGVVQRRAASCGVVRRRARCAAQPRTNRRTLKYSVGNLRASCGNRRQRATSCVNGRRKLAHCAVLCRTLRVEGANDAMTMMSLRKVSRGHQLSSTQPLRQAQQ